LTSLAGAQISLPTAVDLALRNNPRVKSGQDDVTRAQAQIDEAHDVYIPTLSVGAAIGQAYGYLPYPPTLFTISSSSLVYNPAQHYYIRSARAGMDAARLSLQDTCDGIAEDVSIAYIALQHDSQRAQVIQQQMDYANALVGIVEQRADAGQDTQIELTQAKLTAAQLHVSSLHAQDDTAADREHLALLIGQPADSLSAIDDFPSTPMPVDSPPVLTTGGYANPGVASLFASAEAKSQQAEGDARFRLYPLVNFFAQYNRYATFTNSFTKLKDLEPDLTANEAAVGVQFTWSLIDKSRQAKVRESQADAAHAIHDAQNAQLQALDTQSRSRHSLAELEAQADVAELKQQLAQQQLDVLRVQLQAGNPNGAAMTPKDEQNARIDERDKYLGVLDATFQLRQAEIHLLRQTGQLEGWIKSAKAQTPTPAAALIP
jgi:outer membrane protein TolC